MLFFYLAVKRSFWIVFVMLSCVCSARAEEDPNQLCESLSLMAKNIMSARQAGVEMSTLIKKADENISKGGGDEDSEKIGAVAKEYIEHAYEYPFAHYEDMRKEVIVEFGNGVYSMCYKTQRKLRP